MESLKTIEKKKNQQFCHRSKIDTNDYWFVFDYLSLDNEILKNYWKKKQTNNFSSFENFLFDGMKYLKTIKKKKNESTILSSFENFLFDRMESLKTI